MNKVFKALSDPTRRRILELLRVSDLSSGEISASFQMTDASISHHLSILYSAELVTSEKKGQKVIYSLNTTVFQDIIDWFFNLKGGSL